MFPLFIVEDDNAKQEIKAMPGQFRWGCNSVVEYLRPLVQSGLRSVLLFGVLSDDSKKDDIGSVASSTSGPACRAVRRNFLALLCASLLF
jgi:porphobilinogen synthase